MTSHDTITALAELQMRRKFHIKGKNRLQNSACALVRRQLGWDPNEDEAKRESVNGRAATIVATAIAGKEQKEADEDAYLAVAADMEVLSIAMEPLESARHHIELEMKRIVRKMPIYEWAKEVRGLGELGLAVIIAEAGDLAAYPKKGHLWKRLGLAPYEGKAASTWRGKGGLSAEEWTWFGYSPQRRAQIHAVVAEPLFRQQTVTTGPYRQIYDARRARMEAANPEWSKLHLHRDGLRIMTKYLLRDLWKEWNRLRAGADVPSKAKASVPTADTDRPHMANKEAERQKIMEELAAQSQELGMGY